MAKVEIKNTRKVLKELKKLFKSVSKSKKLTNEIGDFSVKRIKQAARSGKSLESNNTREKLPKLKRFTKKLREALLDTAPELFDDLAKPGRSNVTLTGQLVDAVNYEVKNNKIFIVIDGLRTNIDFESLYKTAKIKFGPRDERTKILGFATSWLDDSQEILNRKVYENLKDLGFGFIGMDKKGQDRIIQLVLREFRRQIKLKS